MALYPPGSFYRKHLDQFRGATHRKVSAILYLNPDWSPADGGELRLYLAPSGEGDHLDIAPLGGTLVTFLSDRFHHEVLPTRRERRSLTGWFRVRE
jgi:SM-20-related protein